MQKLLYDICKTGRAVNLRLEKQELALQSQNLRPVFSLYILYIDEMPAFDYFSKISDNKIFYY